MSRRLVSTEVAAVALGVTPATVRKWRERKILTRHGTRRQALVDLLECERIRFPECA